MRKINTRINKIEEKETLIHFLNKEKQKTPAISPVHDVLSKFPRKWSMASYRIEEISVSEMPWAMINLLVKIKKGMSHDENAVGNLSLW